MLITVEVRFLTQINWKDVYQGNQVNNNETAEQDEKEFVQGLV
jgi:hypothetical protein